MLHHPNAKPIVAEMIPSRDNKMLSTEVTQAAHDKPVILKRPVIVDFLDTRDETEFDLTIISASKPESSIASLIRSS